MRCAQRVRVIRPHRLVTFFTVGMHLAELLTVALLTGGACRLRFCRRSTILSTAHLRIPPAEKVGVLGSEAWSWRGGYSGLACARVRNRRKFIHHDHRRVATYGQRQRSVPFATCTHMWRSPARSKLLSEIACTAERMIADAHRERRIQVRPPPHRPCRLLRLRVFSRNHH